MCARNDMGPWSNGRAPIAQLRVMAGVQQTSTKPDCADRPSDGQAQSLSDTRKVPPCCRRVCPSHRRRFVVADAGVRSLWGWPWNRRLADRRQCAGGHLLSNLQSRLRRELGAGHWPVDSIVGSMVGGVLLAMHPGLSVMFVRGALPAIVAALSMFDTGRYEAALKASAVARALPGSVEL
jgi:hypothetical protein